MKEQTKQAKKADNLHEMREEARIAITDVFEYPPASNLQVLLSKLMYQALYQQILIDLCSKDHFDYCRLNKNTLDS